jgi:hypothetical protein
MLFEGVPGVPKSSLGRMASSTTACHKVQKCHYLLSKSSEFAAITLCIPSWQVFIIVYVKCSPQFSNGWFCLKSHLGKTVSVTHEILKRASTDNVMGRTQSLGWFSSFKHGEHLVDC